MLGGGKKMFEFFKYLFDKLNTNEIENIPKLRNNGQSIFNYEFMMALDKKYYKKYLCQAYFIKTGQKLNLRCPKTLNEKIQWLKIYDNLPIKTQLTDKVLVRDWIKEKIGEEYLKPVLWIGDKFDEIPFENLPNSFIIKTNHGCKWQIIVKDKAQYISNAKLVNTTKKFFEEWLNQSFFGWSDFETQYINIEPKIIIEQLLQEPSGEKPQEFEIWCFNGVPKIFQKLKFDNTSKLAKYHTFDENFNDININFFAERLFYETEADDYLKKAVELSKTLSQGFKLARVDWMSMKNKLYFEKMTFTPQSGFIFFPENHNELQLKLGEMLKLKEN